MLTTVSLDLIAEKLAGVLRTNFDKVKYITRDGAVYLDGEVPTADKTDPFPHSLAKVELTLVVRPNH